MEKSADQLQTEKLFKKICRKIGTTMRDHQMILEGDHLLVGLSGGKDSMILLEALAERLRALPFEFTLTAAHVEAEGIGYEIDKERLTSFCETLGIPLLYRAIRPDLERDPSKTDCFICSWYRRKELFKLTKELGCNKLALGHHRKDALETLLMNMIYHGSISSLPYSLSLFEGRVQLIRPMMDLEESMLKDYARLNNLVHVEKSCPHEDRTNLHGPGPYNMFKSMNKIVEEYLPVKH